MRGRIHAGMNDHQLPVSAATAGAFASNPRAVRLLLANDEQRLFDNFRAGLDSEFEVVATAGTSAEALRLSLDHQPDVVLLASCQPGQETASLRRLKALPRPPKLFVLTDHDDEDFSSVM